MTAILIRRCLGGILLALPFVTVPVSANADEIVTIDTREDTRQRFAIFEPKSSAKGLVVMLPGHKGVVRFSYDDHHDIRVQGKRGGLTSHHSVRKALVKNDFIVVMTAPSSDAPMGLENKFRASYPHAVDLSFVIGYLKKRYEGKKLYVWGHSRSTISALNVVAANKSIGIDGMVLSSTWKQAGKTLPTKDVNLPVLLIHHVSDECENAPYAAMDKIQSDLKQGGARVARVHIRGGALEVKGKGCHTNFHGMDKVRGRVATTVMDWIQGQVIVAEMKW